jgi:hypothetical protein
MMHFDTIAKQFVRVANVGNVLSVLLVVIILVIKPAGATMV